MTLDEFKMYAAAVSNMPCVRIKTKDPQTGQESFEVYVHMRTLLGVLRDAALASEPPGKIAVEEVPQLDIVKQILGRN